MLAFSRVGLLRHVHGKGIDIGIVAFMTIVIIAAAVRIFKWRED